MRFNARPRIAPSVTCRSALRLARWPPKIAFMRKTPVLGQRPPVVAHLPLPCLAAHPPDVPQVRVPGQRRPGRVTVPPDPGVLPGRDEDAARAGFQRPVHLPLVVGPV